MNSYLKIVNDVLDHGIKKSNRTGVDTISLPHIYFTHDMSDGFPLLTTRRMPIKSIAVELEGFLNGITSKNWYNKNGCKYWNNWGEPCCIERRLAFNKLSNIFKSSKEVAKEVDELGAIYPWQYKKFGECYGENDDGVLQGVDQIQYILDLLKTNPNSRRMVCSAWNPNQIQIMSLPPCHYSFVLNHINGTLHLMYTSRSADLGLGVPCNIAFYALLLLLFCKEYEFKPGRISALISDCHIYVNHIDQLRMQMARLPYRLPQLNITNWTGFTNWTHKDIELINYKYHPRIKMEIAI